MILHIHIILDRIRKKRSNYEISWRPKITPTDSFQVNKSASVRPGHMTTLSIGRFNLDSMAPGAAIGATLAVNHPTYPFLFHFSTEKRKMKNRPKNRVSSMEFFLKNLIIYWGKTWTKLVFDWCQNCGFCLVTCNLTKIWKTKLDKYRFNSKFLRYNLILNFFLAKVHFRRGLMK